MHDDEDDAVNEILYCPTCGRPTEQRLQPEWLADLFPSTTHGFRIFDLLLAKRKVNASANLTEIIMAVWFEDVTKAPETFEQIVRVTIARMNQKLRPRGWTIATPAQTRAGYQLVQLAEQQ